MSTSFPLMLNGEQIQKLLPHGPGFCFVKQATIDYESPDEQHHGHLYLVTSLLTVPQPTSWASLIKNHQPWEELSGAQMISLVLSYHFPNWPVMSGVILLEMMGQTGAILLRLNNNDILRQVKTELALPKNLSQYIGVFTGFDGVEFKRSVVPGDEVKITFVLDSNDLTLRKQVFTGRARAELHIGPKLAVSIRTISFSMVPPKK